MAIASGREPAGKLTGPPREQIPLTVRRTDECDQGECPAAVQVAVLLPHGQLGFCAHHWHVLEPMVLLACGRYTTRQVGDLKV